MDKPKHTPGPWRVTAAKDTVRCDTVPNVGMVAECLGFERYRREADAHLIAAAPELLDALKACAEAIRHAEAERDPYNRLMPPLALQMAEEAIRKATGEE